MYKWCHTCNPFPLFQSGRPFLSKGVYQNSHGIVFSRQKIIIVNLCIWLQISDHMAKVVSSL